MTKMTARVSIFAADVATTNKKTISWDLLGLEASLFWMALAATAQKLGIDSKDEGLGDWSMSLARHASKSPGKW